MNRIKSQVEDLQERRIPQGGNVGESVGVEGGPFTCQDRGDGSCTTDHTVFATKPQHNKRTRAEDT